MIELGVNIDHVATLRQARHGNEPDPVWAAVEAELGGADGITIHLREDRRHINDRDVRLLRQSVQCKLNLELSIAADVVDMAVECVPDQATFVPERRLEITTEGGIDLTTGSLIAKPLERLKRLNIFVSAFVVPDEKQIIAAAKMGFDAVELHTGDYANAKGAQVQVQLDRLRRAGELAANHHLRLHAGHGLNYRNIGPVAAMIGMAEVNIGHAIISRSVFVGLREAVREMKQLLSL